MSIRSKVHDFVHPEWHPSRADSAIALASFIGVPLVLGALSGLWAQKDIKSWYSKLRKPKWTPPAWVFGPMWSVLYILLGFSSWSVWTHGGTEKQKVPLGFYLAALLANLAWTPLFFKARTIDLALLEVLGQLGLLTSTLVSFHSVEPLASLVLVPVWLVTAFAVFLTFSIFRMNPGKGRQTLNRVYRSIDKMTNNKGA